jgi:RecA-family ATPase
MSEGFPDDGFADAPPADEFEVVPLSEALALRDIDRLGLVDPCALQGEPVPERRWLVPHLIPRGAVTMLSGDGGVGKSLLAMQLMTAGAIGGKWIGIDVPRFKSLGYFCEDDRPELHRRQAAINHHMNCDFADLEAMRWWPRVGGDNVLVQYAKDSHAPPSLKQGFKDMQNIVRTLGIELIVIDTVADVFGGNENFRAEVRSFIAHMRELARINDGAVLLTAHPSVAGQASGTGLSGSTAWNNSVRSRLYLTKPKAAADEDDDGRQRELKGMKANYAEAGAKLKLRYEQGVFVRSEDGGYNQVTAIEQRNMAKKFAELVAIANVRGLILGPNRAANYAPKLLADLPEAEGIAPRALARAMHEALKDGLVLSVEEGPPSKRRPRLVVPDQATR